MEDKQYVATMRVSFTASDDVEAEIVANKLAEAVSEVLDPECGEEVYVTQIVSSLAGVTPEELLVRLRPIRNALIRTKLRRCIDVAREIDGVIQSLEKGDLESILPYDHGRFMDIAESVLMRGEDPQ